MRRYFDFVTIQAPVTTRSSSGEVIEAEYVNVAGLVDLPARIVPMVVEQRGQEMTLVTDRFNVLLAGDHRDVRPEMVVLDGEAVYNVLRVVPSPLGRRARRQTMLECERVALG